jgi:competence protein ComEC
MAGFEMAMNLDAAIRFCGVALVCASLSACVAPQQQSNKPLQIVSIDVDGGAATLYITPEGKSLLIDAGWPAGRGGPRRAPGGGPSNPPASSSPLLSSADRIIATARQLGLSRLDYVLITHYHVDHVGGFGELLGKFPVGTVLDHGPNRELVNETNSSTPPTELFAAYESLVAGRPRHSLKAGEQIRISSMVLTTVTSDGKVPGNPLPGAGQPVPECATMSGKTENGGEENSRSVGVLLTFGNARVVSLGDLTWNAEQALVCPVNKVGRADLFFVSNHGSNLNNSPALLHALAPRVVVMGNGSRKGGDPETYETVSTSPGLRRLWQLHLANKGGRERNPPEAYIANLTDEPDRHAALYISVFADGSLTVKNGRTGYSESYPSPDTKSAGK